MTATPLLSLPTALEDLAEQVAADLRAGRDRRVVAPGGFGKTRFATRVTSYLEAAEAARVAHLPGGPVARRDGTSTAAWSIVVDDAHLLDPAELEAAHPEGFGRLLLHRPTDTAAATLLDRIDPEPVVLVPFTVRDLAAMLSHRPTDDADPPVVPGELVHRTGGVARFVHVLLEATDTDTADALIAQIVQAERRRLSPAADALLLAAAVTDPLDTAWSVVVAGLRDLDAIRARTELRSAGLVAPGTDDLLPVVRGALRQTSCDVEVAAIADRLAAVALARGAVEQVTPRLLDLRAAGPHVARCLLAAAQLPVERRVAPARVLLDAAEQAGLTGTDRAAGEVLLAADERRSAAALRALDQVLEDDLDHTRAAAVLAAAALLGAEGAWQRCADLAVAAAPHLTHPVGRDLAALGHLAVGEAEAVQRLVGEPERVSGAEGLVAARSHALLRGLAATLEPDPGNALVDLLEAVRLDRMVTAPWRLAEPAPVVAATVAAHLWELDIASELVAEDEDGAGRDLRRPLLRAWIDLQRGDWLGAEEQVNRLAIRHDGVAATPRDRLLADAVRAGSARRRGDLEALLEVWRRARTWLLRTAPDLFLVQPLGELLIAGARLGDRGTVASCLQRVRDLLPQVSAAPVWTLPVRWFEVQVAIASDDLETARIAAREAAELPSHAPRSRAVVVAAQVWAESLSGRVRPDDVRRAARDLAEVGAVWEAARLAGAAAIRLPDSTDMRELLRFARSLPTAAAPSLADHDGELSPREREVAAHLLGGLTYREIGAQLFIAPKTVEHHVARIRRKLGAGSRAELLVALRRHVPASQG